MLCTVVLTCHQQFEEAGLHPVIVENIQLCKYDVPMPIQSYIIPAVLSGHDVVGISQTGLTVLLLCFDLC
jgi:ATP-dependent RNA helicase DDX3X